MKSKQPKYFRSLYDVESYLYHRYYNVTSFNRPDGTTNFTYRAPDGWHFLSVEYRKRKLFRKAGYYVVPLV